MTAAGYAGTASPVRRRDDGAMPVAFRRSYPGEAGQVSQARHDVAEALGKCPAADDIVLCTSELVTNSVLHSRSGQAGGRFTIAVTRIEDEQVTVHVIDDGGPWRGGTSHGDSEVRGRGLSIVAAFAVAMGIHGHAGTRTVWFSCPWNSP
jgi:anti-sigma regulatory factor (Ser/Thr protein kinase)